MLKYKVAKRSGLLQLQQFTLDLYIYLGYLLLKSFTYKLNFKNNCYPLLNTVLNGLFLLIIIYELISWCISEHAFLVLCLSTSLEKLLKDIKMKYFINHFSPFSFLCRLIIRRVFQKYWTQLEQNNLHLCEICI